MLNGFSVPLTPQGKSAAVLPPPWHYSSDCLAIEYWTDPAAVAAVPPPGPTPDQKSGGRTFFWFLEWQFTDSNNELTMSPTDNLAIVDVWAGSAQLSVPDIAGEDRHSFAPRRVGRGYRTGIGLHGH
jgi:hypothetical protein